ncbi:MAG: AbrB/MazE/SpoVT family DNA-binding domain-containing protein [Sulfuricella sp.]|nr:AbrB/MazE/SpoVT family DNA-binding domain-containing protein [Sulfuricella sp.]
MPTATLRKVGGSVVVSIPKRILELVHLQSGSQVSIEVQDGKLVVAPKNKPRYTLEELMAQCDLTQPMGVGEREWIDAPAVGSEEI